VPILKSSVVPSIAVSVRRSTLLLSIMLACGEEELPPETGIDLTIAYDSTMGVERLVIWGTTDRGTTRIDQHTLDAPFSVDPPGLRVAPIDLVLREALEGETVVVRVDGRAPDGRVVGSGATTVIVELARLIPATVTLGAPIQCGDGRTSNLEACDDGNEVAGDGCTEVCTIEPGHVCQGSPSICGRCGDGTAQGGEQCDDENTIDGDGCSSACTLEGVVDFIHEVERPEPANTTSAEFVDIPGATLTFTPNGPNERWIVFVSGVLGSSDPGQLAAEMRLTINGVEVDRFGHQTLGATDNEAGFVTFDTIVGATEDQVIAPQFRATLGTTRVSNLRVVAALLPAGSDFQYVEADELLETAGENLELLRLDFTPSRAGEYVVLAKSNLTEDPSPSTARFWLEDDAGGAHPLDGFSSPRDAVLPAFVSIVKPLDLSPKSFVVRGTSSLSAPATDWWNDASMMRQGIAITAPENGLPAGYPLSITFDHATQVAAGRSLPNGDDVFVVARLSDGTLAPIDRVVDDASGWNRADSKIWFATVEGITPEYWLYWGTAMTQLPPSDPQRVFPFFDRFDDVELDPARWSEVRANAAVQNGQLVLGPQSSIISAAGRQYAADTVWEAQVTLTANSALTGELEIWTAENEQQGASVGFLASAEGLRVQAGGTIQLVQPMIDPLAPHLWSFVRTAQGEVSFAIDGQALATLSDALSAFSALSVHMSNGDPAVAMSYDWVRVRPRLAVEPVVALGAIEGRMGLPSRWTFRKLMAFRTDVFARAYHVSMPATVTTKEATPMRLTSIEVDAPPAPVDELVIAAARVSGETSELGRKSGEIRANGELLVRTAHRIDRDSSRENGYHHVVGVADARITRESAQYQIDIVSPDLIQVDGAGATITVLSYPARQ
jgi:cysteine-rich repeat protein